MVQLTFLIESSFISLTAIAVGTLLGSSSPPNACDHLYRGAHGRDGHDVRACTPRIAHLPGPGTSVSVAWHHRLYAFPMTRKPAD